MVQMFGWFSAEAALKTVECERIFFRFRRQELERDMATQVDVLGFVHHAHPSPAQLREDTVVRDGLADHGLAGHPENTPGRERFMLGLRVLASQTSCQWPVVSCQ